MVQEWIKHAATALIARTVVELSGCGATIWRGGFQGMKMHHKTLWSKTGISHNRPIMTFALSAVVLAGFICVQKMAMVLSVVGVTGRANCHKLAEPL